MTEFKPMTNGEITAIADWADANGSIGLHSAKRLIKQIEYVKTRCAEIADQFTARFGEDTAASLIRREFGL